MSKQSATQPPEPLVRANLDWLGYGHPDARFWFFEYEESGYDPNRYAECETLVDVLEHRKQYGEFIDFKRAWETLSDYPLTSFTNWSYTWNFEAAFLLGAEGNADIENSQTHDYAFREARLGRRDGNNFSAEARPLPKSDVTGTGPYSHIWPSADIYHVDVIQRRQEQLDEYLRGNETVEWIIISGKNNLMFNILKTMFNLSKVESYDVGDKRPYTHYTMQVTDDQSVNVVDAPFFGNGHASYDGAAAAGYHFIHEA